MKRKKLFTIGARVTISCLLLVYLLKGYGLKGLKQVVTVQGLPYLLLAVGIHYCEKLLKIYNLKRLLVVNNTHVKFINLVKISWISTFFGFFLPSSSGPDLIRIHRLRSHSANYSTPISATLVANVCGVFAAAVLALVGIILLNFTKIEIRINIVRGIFWVMICIFFLFFLFLSPKIRFYMSKILDIDLAKRVPSVQRFFKEIVVKLDMQVSIRNMLSTVSISILALIIGCVRTFFISHSVGIAIPIIYFFILVPSALLITSLPISIGGLGIRESLFVAFFYDSGFDSGRALTIGLLVSMLNMSIALIGGVLYISETAVKRK